MKLQLFILLGSFGVAFGQLENYEHLIVPSAPEDTKREFEGMSLCSAFSKEDTEKFLSKLIEKATKSKKASELFEENRELAKKWDSYHDSILSLWRYRDNPYNSKDFYMSLANVCIETHDFLELSTKVINSTKGAAQERFMKSGAGIYQYYRVDIANVLISSWRMQKDTLRATEGLVLAELTWTLTQSECIYYGVGDSEGHSMYWGGVEDALMRGLLCNPQEVVEVLKNKKILDVMDVSTVKSIPKQIKAGLAKRIGHRQGEFSKGKYILNSPLIEKRRKAARDTYLPQIEKIVAEYLKTVEK